MKKLLLVAAASVAALSTASANVLDFEAFGAVNTEGTLIVGNEFEADFGVTFSSVDDDLFLVQVGAPQIAFVRDDTPDPSGAFGTWFMGTSFDDAQTDLTITWTTPVDGFSFEMADIDDDEVFNFEVFDASNNLLATRTISSGDANTGNLQVTPVGFSNLGAQIARVTLTGTRGSARLGIAFDNFNTTRDATVPVPAALPLFAAGMAGFGALRRRKKA
ncbi:MAG: VPLPA-CTERM sorting domain-containing protein [Pseudomonadota bacterium]